MADELDPVVQQFIADMRRYIEPIAQAAREAKEFAQDNRQLSQEIVMLRESVDKNTTELQRMRNALAEDKAATDGLRDSSATLAEETGHVRDTVLEEAIALDKARDKELEGKEAADQLRDASVEAGTALGHVRDEAAMAAHEVGKLGTQAEETSAKLDLMGLSGMSTMSSLGPMLGIIGALVIAIAAIAPAAAAAGLGMGAFGAFAIPTVMSVFKALKDTHAQLMKLPAGERAIVEGFKGLKTEFQQISAAFRPEVLGILRSLLDTARTLLPIVVPLAQEGARAFKLLVDSINSGVKSSGFQSFISLMTRMVVPATRAIIGLAGAILGVLGKALTTLAPLSVPFIHVLTTITKALGGPLAAALHAIISVFLALAKSITPLLGPTSKLSTIIINELGTAFTQLATTLGPTITLIGQGLITVIKELMPLIQTALTPNSPFITALHMLPPILHVVIPLITGLLSIFENPVISRIAVDVFGAVIAFKELTKVIALVRNGFMLLNVVMDMNPVGLIIIAIVALIAIFVELWTHCKAFRDFWKTTWKDIQSVAEAAWHFIDNNLIHPLMSGIEKMVDFVKTHLKLMALIIATVLLGPVGFIVAFIAEHWSQITSFTARMVGDVVRFFTSLPGKIVSAIRSGISMVYNIGRQVVEGFINGIKSMVGAVVGAAESLVSGLGHTVEHMLGIGSPSRVFYMHGRNTILGFVNGMRDALPMITSVTSDMHRALSNGMPKANPVPSMLPFGALAGSGGGASAPSSQITLTPSITVYLDGQKVSGAMRTTNLEYNRRNPAANVVLRVR